MLFKLHYFFMDGAFAATNVLIGVYLKFYTDASASEIGMLYMMSPFLNLVFRPIASSLADRHRAHRKLLMGCLFLSAASFLPYVAIPFIGPSLYEAHPRVCWYLLACCKLLGDVFYGSSYTIGDALAVNVCKRLGTEMSHYLMSGIVSYMGYGLLMSYLNEVWFLPRYVAGLMLHVANQLLDMLAMYLWPPEYFVMATQELVDHDRAKRTEQSWTRSLVPAGAVWSHAKGQLRALATCSCLGGKPKEKAVELQHTPRGHKPDLEAIKAIDKRTQLLVLLTLLRRDPRLIGYLMASVAMGASLIPTSFFFMSLADVCHTNNRCDFSQLAGLIQLGLSFTESLSLVFMAQLVAVLGRLNTLAFAFGLSALRYCFYSTSFWSVISPHWAILSEMLLGVSYEIFMILMKDLAHSFALQVEQLLPELEERGLIRPGDERQRAQLKVSLPATMQALFASACEGLGRGLGALAFGFIIDASSYKTLWLVIGLGNSVVFLVLLAGNLYTADDKRRGAAMAR